ncbi:hypothetical protein KUF54_16155 [Comamonas sp. Y33R10-2]|uniref:hypothetical protein n=1 Tax=Comamonas sp. Y33R10-2 TaxID=2853257 RepID=UPI001C5C8D66|nr:hypothetical protein [Comamonas sp. Y33R10-2]QXZ09520.1 hypothetical protein KUF54_16155 [Comamonas sp. Y33R10-2]
MVSLLEASLTGIKPKNKHTNRNLPWPHHELQVHPLAGSGSSPQKLKNHAKAYDSHRHIAIFKIANTPLT